MLKSNLQQFHLKLNEYPNYSKFFLIMLLQKIQKNVFVKKGSTTAYITDLTGTQGQKINKTTKRRTKG